MDIRFIAIVALIMAIMEILGRLAKKGVGTGVPGEAPAGSVDPLLQGLEELEWLPGMEDQVSEPARRVAEPSVAERAIAERAVAERAVAQPVAEPAGARLFGVEPAGAQPFAPAREIERRLPPPQAEQVIRYRERAPRVVEVRSREARSIKPRPATPARRVEEAALAASRRAAPDGPGKPRARGERELGLSSVAGLRRLVVAREVLGPPLAMREGDGGLGSS